MSVATASFSTTLPDPAPEDDPKRYQRTLAKLPRIADQIFTNYSKIPRDKILDHIYRVRDQAWDILPYPCIGVFRFLDFGAQLNPVYPEVVQRVRNGAKFLDLGCCFGQDIRKLVYDGAPSENIVGVDSEARFMDLGYDLFCDRETLESKFFTASIFDDFFLPELQGKIDIVYVGAFLHLFGFERQKQIVAQLAKLLRKEPGSMVFGRNIAADTGGDFRMKAFDHDLYRHSPETMQALWSLAPEGQWRVEAELGPYGSEAWDDKHRGWEGEETKEMRFAVKRV